MSGYEVLRNIEFWSLRELIYKKFSTSACENRGDQRCGSVTCSGMVNDFICIIVLILIFKQSIRYEAP